MTLKTPCPCTSSQPYAACCGPLHGGQAAISAKALMRSRYSAFVLGLEAYLLATWHPSSRPPSLDLLVGPRPKWLGLEVKKHQNLGLTEAWVEFVARYRVNGRGQRLHETSRFVREEGRWFYVDGEVHEPR